MMLQQGQELIAVQTLRNGMMVTSFLATVASTLGKGYFCAIWILTKLGFLTLRFALNQKDNGDDARAIFHIVLSGFLFLAFVNFAITIRGFTHSGFIVAARSVDPAVEKFLDAGIYYLILQLLNAMNS